MQLHFDFTKSATRASILDQLRSHIGDAEWAVVTTDAAKAGVPKHHHHGIVEVRQTIDALNASQSVKDHLRGVYEILATAEAQVHECEVDHTHFHEVGNGEAILNTLVICCAFDYLHPDFVTATPVQTGSGTVECAHGLMDIPAPATAAILETGIPVCDQKLEGELCTPTSAAIIKHFVNEFA
ncbi:MAG TPA: hypothetical protein DCP91_01310 [Eggerthellaceae bacterium]|nr:hypothetical protein [Eggerthellaceae bacterium]